MNLNFVYLLQESETSDRAARWAAATRASIHATTHPAPSVASAFQTGEVRLPDHWPAQTDLLDWCNHMGPGMAALLIILGVVYLLFGFSMFRWLVLLNAAAAGAVLGAIIGDKTGGTAPLAIVGAVALAAVTWPTMKYAVALMGGAFGAMVGATVWLSAGLESSYTWSGALCGLIGGGLLCFILFRGCLVMYTSLQGSVMLIFGILGLIYKYQDLAPKVGSYLSAKTFVLPMCIFIPTIIGILYQHSTPVGPKPGAPAPPKK